MIQNVNNPGNRNIESRYTYFTDIQQEAISVPLGMDRVFETYLKLMEHERQITQATYNEDETQSELEKYLKEIKEEVKKALDIPRSQMAALRAMGYDIEHMSPEEIRFVKEALKEDLPEDYTRTGIDDVQEKSIEDKIEVITSQKESMFLESLKEKGELTVNKLYENSYKGVGKTVNTDFTDEEINKILEMNDLPKTKGNKWAAKLLLVYQKEVTPKDITKLQNIRSVAEALKEQNNMLKSDTPLMVDGQVMYTKEQTDAMKHQLNTITDQQIAQFLKEEKPLTLSSLRELVKNSHMADKKDGEISGQKENIGKIRQSITYLTKHLTPQKMQRLSKDIPLDDYPIEEIASRLKNIDEAFISDVLSYGGLSVTPENAEWASKMLAIAEGMDQTIPDLARRVGELMKQGVHPDTDGIDEITGKLYRCSLEDMQNTIADLIDALKTAGMLTDRREGKLRDLYQTVTTIIDQEEAVKGYLLKNGAPVIIDDLSTAAKRAREDASYVMIMDDNTAGLSDLENTIYAIKNDLRQVNSRHIAAVIGENKEVNIAHLREALYQNTKKVLGSKEYAKAEDDTGSIDTVKRQIKQICARLTAEAVQKMSLRMPLESMELSKLLNALNEAEDQMVQEALKDAGLQETEENKNIVKNSLLARGLISENRQEALNLELGASNKLLIKEMHEALMAYEANETMPEKRFGETTARVSDQIQNYLTKSGIPYTKDHELAARALIANQMEVTKENIENIMPMIEKLDGFIKEMTPHRAASMIKEGLNPYLSTVDSILEWAAQEEFPELRTSLSEAIVKLEDSGAITQEQKSSMLGLYRILDTAEKNKADIVGYLYKHDLPLTIEKLNEAASYIDDKRHINTAIDDNYGMLEGVKYDHKTARMMIHEAKAHIEKVTRLVSSLEHAQLPVNEATVSDFKNIDKTMYKMIQETFKEEMAHFEGMDTLPPSFTEKLEAVKNIHPETIHTLVQNEIPVTLSNLYWMDQILQNPQTFMELVKEAPLQLNEYPVKMKDMHRAIDNLEKEAKSRKHQAVESGDMPAYKTYKQISELVKLQKQLTDKDVVYQIPFSLNGEVKLVNVYFNRKVQETGKSRDTTHVTILYETKSLGKLKTELEVTGKKVHFTIYANNLEAAEKLRKHEHSLKNFIGQLGYQIEESSIKTQQNDENHVSDVKYKTLNMSQFEQIG